MLNIQQVLKNHYSLENPLEHFSISNIDDNTLFYYLDSPKVRVFPFKSISHGSTYLLKIILNLINLPQ